MAVEGENAIARLDMTTAPPRVVERFTPPDAAGVRFSADGVVVSADGRQALIRGGVEIVHSLDLTTTPISVAASISMPTSPAPPATASGLAFYAGGTKAVIAAGTAMLYLDLGTTPPTVTTVDPFVSTSPPSCSPPAAACPLNSIDVAVNPAGTRAAVALDSGGLQVVDLTTSPPSNLGPPLGPTGDPLGVAISKDGARAIFVYESIPAPQAVVVNLTGAMPALEATVPLSLAAPSAVAINPATGDAVITGDDGLAILHPPFSAVARVIARGSAAGTARRGLAISPDGARALVLNEDGPQLLIAPAAGPSAGGTAVTLLGGAFTAATTVTFGGVPAASVQLVSSQQLTAVTPAHAAGPVDVGTSGPGGTQTVTGGFSYLAAPVVSSVAPAAGPAAGGTAVTIGGTDFAAGASVSLGGSAATGVVVVSATSITATTAAHAAGAVDVKVTNADGQAGALAGGYTFVAPPAVTGVSPAAGPVAGGTAITLSGAGFRPGAAVSLGGIAATGVAVVSATSITATTAAHAAGAVDVQVTNADGQAGALAGGFTFVAPPPPPSLATLSPPQGPAAGGTQVTLGGKDFADGATVAFGGAAAVSVRVVSAVEITATTPPHARGPVDVTVTNPDGQAGSLVAGYTYQPASGCGCSTRGDASRAPPLQSVLLLGLLVALRPRRRTRRR